MRIDFYYHNEGGSGKDPVLRELNVVQDGTYTPQVGVDGFSKVTAKHEFEQTLHIDTLNDFPFASEKGWKRIDSQGLIDENVVEVTENKTIKGYNPVDGKVFENIEINVPSITTETMTQAEYDSIPHENNVLYCITD